MSSLTAGGLPSWMMFERFVFRRDDDKDGPFPDEAAAPMRASSITSLGDPFVVAVLPAAPPAVSRVYVQWPRGARSLGVSCGTELLTADKGLLLLRLTSDVKLGPNETDKYPYKQDYFVCNCRSSTFPPSISIRRLPECTEPIVFRMGKTDRSVDRRFHADAVGLCRLGDEFAVVQLAKFFVGANGKIMGAELCMLRSALWTDDDDLGSDIVAEGKWELLTPAINHHDEEFNDLRRWSTDGTITFGDSIVWVDYHQGGMMSYRLRPETGDEANFISYHRLPIDNRPRDSLPSKHLLEKYRSLCITGEKSGGGAHLKFVDVVRTDDAYFGPIAPGSSFTVTCHTFTPDVDHMWHKDSVFTSRQLQYLNSRKPLMSSNAVTTFPVVSRDDPNLVYFLVSENKDMILKVSVVVIDMITETIVSVFPYILGEEDLCGEYADMVRHRSRLPRSLLPTRF